MNTFYEFVIKEIKDDIATLLTDEKAPIRILFSGLPKGMLNLVFTYLCDGEKQLQVTRDEITKAIPILLVDSSIDIDPKDLNSGRCTNNHLVTVRNTEEGSYFALHAIDDATNLSSETAAERRGISTQHHKSIIEWLEEVFVSNILNDIISKFHINEQESVKYAISEALTQAWDGDQRHRDRRAVWAIIEDVYVLTSNNHNSSCLYESLGVPSIENGDVKEALVLPQKIASYFVDNGFDSGTDLMINELSDEELDIKEALKIFINAISVNCLMPSEFLDNPMANYAKANTYKEFTWWNALTNKVWEKLLGGYSEPQEFSILKIVCQDTLYNPVSKSHPEVIQKGASFIIIPAEGQDDVELEISKASGNKALQVVDKITIKGEEVTWEDNVGYLEHDFFVKYQFSSESLAKPIVHKVIELESFKPQITTNCRSATKITPFKFKMKKGKKAKQNNEGHYECQIELNGIGSHTLDLYHISGLKLDSTMTGFFYNDSDIDGIQKNITPSSDGHAVCLIDADEDCTYEFELDDKDSNVTQSYKINITVSEFIPKGVSSEFRKLVIASCGGKTALKVDVRQTMLSNFEHWLLNDSESYCPVVLGPGVKNKWTKPSWNTNPVISEMKLFLDPRPTFETLKASIPDAYVESREHLRGLIKGLCDKDGDSIESLNFGLLYLEDKFKLAFNSYINEYFNWLKSDYETAIWSDILTVHGEESSKNCLKSIPDAVLLSPFHPVRIAWHCNAQSVLEDARKNDICAPSTGVIDPSVFPDCLALPCLNANSTPEYKGFAAVRASSDYWSVLWSTDNISNVNDESYDSIFGDEFGVTIDGMAQGFSVQQVKRSLDDVCQLACAKSTLSISLTSDTSGQSSCNAGVEEWCEENLGFEQDEWSIAGANSLRVYDTRPIKSQPEPAILAALTARSGTNVRWYTKENNEGIEKRDLAIIDHLQTMSNTFEKHHFNSAVDPTCLYRKSIKHSFSKQNKFLAESRVGYFITPTLEEGGVLRHYLVSSLQLIEDSCKEYDLFDSLVFAPNLKTLEDSLNNTDFCAVSSSTVDASCFHMPEKTSLLWDYELPKYSAEQGQSSGFYLLARESENMHEALKNALVEFQDETPVTKEQSKGLLQEISLRGMPTLKKITSGGTSSLGEIGMLVALRLLQTEFQTSYACSGLIPVSQDSHVNLIIPADIFQPRFDSLRAHLKAGGMERPDLIVISLGIFEGNIKSMRITPVEVKARSGKMMESERVDAIKQAITFSSFMEQIQSESENNEIWGIAWREMLASWIDYGFRVYGEIDSLKKIGSEWSKLHQTTMINIMSQDIDIEIDKVGRLISLESCLHGEVISTVDKDFKDTIILSHQSAASLLGDKQESVIANISASVGNWNFLSKIIEEKSPENIVVKDTDQDKEHTSPSSGKLDEDKVCTEEVSSGIHFKVGESLDKFENKDISFYPGNTALNNINIGVVGDLGTGKTQLLKSIVYQLVNKPEHNRGLSPKVLILDYKRDFSDPTDEKCDFIERTNVKVVKPKDLPLNIFNTSDSSSDIPWLDRYSFFRDVLSKIFSSQKPIQDDQLKEAVKKCFSEADGRDPTIYDVNEAYKEIIGNSRDTTSSAMGDMIDYQIFESNPEKIVKFETFFSGVVALDLKGISDDKIKNMIVVIFLNFYYDYMKKVKKRKFLGEEPQTRFIDSYLLVDEAHNILPYEFPVLSKLLLQGREFGVGVILGSQYFSHFKTKKENYVEPIPTWFVHKVPGIKVSDLDRIGLPNTGQSVIERIASLEVFESLCKTLGHNGEFITGIPFYKLD
jgi:hypothetical protein